MGPLVSLRLGLRLVVPWRGELAQERVGWAVAGHADACVHGDGTVRAGDHGVEVKLGDLWQVVGEPGDPEQGVAQGPDVRGGLAAVTEQQRCGAEGVDQVVGVGAGEGGEAGHVVSEHLSPAGAVT